MLLIGNKSDLKEEKQVDSSMALVDNSKKIILFKEYAKQRNMIYLETSAKTADNTTEAFILLSKKLMQIKLRFINDNNLLEMWPLNTQINLKISPPCRIFKDRN